MKKIIVDSPNTIPSHPHDTAIGVTPGIIVYWGDPTAQIAVACNVAFGYNSPEEVVNAWIESPMHLDSLEGNYDSAAVGIRQDEFGTNYITMILFR